MPFLDVATDEQIAFHDQALAAPWTEKDVLRLMAAARALLDRVRPYAGESYRADAYRNQWLDLLDALDRVDPSAVANSHRGKRP